MACTGVSSCTSGFAINLTDHPCLQLPGHPSAPALPSSVPSPPRPPRLTSCRPGLLPTYLYTHPHTHSPSLKPEERFFQRLPCNISLPPSSLSILKRCGGRGRSSLYPPSEQSSVLKYFSSLVTETAVGSSPENQKDNYT